MTSGITRTVRNDGSINLNGTSSADSYATSTEMYRFIAPFDGQVILNGGASNVQLYVYDYTLGSRPYKDSSKSQTQDVDVTSEDGETTYYIQEGHSLFVQAKIASGTTLSNVVIKPMLRKVTITDSTYEPYHSSVKQVLRDGEVIEGKNLLPVTATSQTINGVTFTVNADNSVTANGTASAMAVFTLNNNLEKVVNGGHYILTGCPSGGGANSYRLEIRNSSDTIYTNGIDEGSGSGDIAPTSGFPAKATIRIASGYTANKVVFKPMLRYASESDPTFEPYYTPLKDSKFDRSEQRVLGAKNLLIYPYTFATQTINGITFTDNGDGTINFIGTASDNALFRLEQGIPLSDGNYSIVSNIAEQGIKLIVQGYQNDTWIKNIVELEDAIRADFTIDYIGYNKIWILFRIAKDKVITNVQTLKPMLILASDPDNTYVPYAMTNKELTEELVSIYNALTASY